MGNVSYFSLNCGLFTLLLCKYKGYANKGESFKPAVSLYTIVTQSMEPNINPYDVIIDATVKNPENIKIGDVITFISTASISRGMTITHRVYDIKQEMASIIIILRVTIISVLT